MARRPEPPLACPICDAPLRRVGGVFTCPTRHSFDVAREGYVNLLPAQHKTRGIEGDLPEMLHARRRFLEAGYFEPLREELARMVAAILAGGGGVGGAVVEVGCGEGYYIGGIGERMAGHDATPLLGTDISKAAARDAAKRYPGVLFFVADVRRRIYLLDGSAAVVLDVFAPRNPDEFARVLAPGGAALVVIPSPTHLASVRARFELLDLEPDKERRVVERFADRFTLADRRELTYGLELRAEAVRDLIDMGPNRWHGRSPDVETGLTTVASFIILRLERRAT